MILWQTGRPEKDKRNFDNPKGIFNRNRMKKFAHAFFIRMLAQGLVLKDPCFLDLFLSNSSTKSSLIVL